MNKDVMWRVIFPLHFPDFEILFPRGNPNYLLIAYFPTENLYLKILKNSKFRVL